jgi:hypothetical protein
MVGLRGGAAAQLPFEACAVLPHLPARASPRQSGEPHPEARLVVTTEGMDVMSENPHKKPDFLEVAKHQLAQISAEFEKALEALKDQERRKQLTSSYLDMLQKGLSKARDSVAKYQERLAPHTTTDPPGEAPAPDSSATRSEPPAQPEPGPPQPEAPTS